MAELARLADVAMAVVRTRATDGLPGVNRWAHTGADDAVWIGPDEWLFIAGDGDAAALVARIAAVGRVVVDVSGNRVRYRLAGAGARGAMARACSIDLDTLLPGSAASTLVARAQAIVMIDGEGYVIAPRRSFGRYLEQWFAAASG